MGNEKFLKQYTCDGDAFLVKCYDDTEKKVLLIESENNPEDPREWFDHADHMVCWHSTLGDKHKYERPMHFQLDMIGKLFSDKQLEEAWKKAIRQPEMLFGRPDPNADFDSKYNLAENIREKLENSANYRLRILRESDDFAFLPLYLLDHSGLRMSTSDFHDPWDSGQVGWIWCSKKEILDFLGAQEEGRWKEAAKSLMESSVKQYDYYLCGDVYRWSLYGINDDGTLETVCDDCGGEYYGDTYKENGILDDFDVIEEIELNKRVQTIYTIAS